MVSAATLFNLMSFSSDQTHIVHVYVWLTVHWYPLQRSADLTSFACDYQIKWLNDNIFLFIKLLYTLCLILFSYVDMNTNVSNDTTELEDFEEFDLRDGLNVAAYSIMSTSKI